MGKIHDALQKAEETRAGLGGAPSGAAHEIFEEPSTSAWTEPPSVRVKQVHNGRRSRVMLADGDTAVSEEYRTLRARIQSLRRVRSVRTIVVTSALPGEGKTTTASNLALSFGLEREFTTCLVDADLRTPKIDQTLLETPALGLAEVLEADAKLKDALVQVPDTRLSVLTVQALPMQPSELLASKKMHDLVEELRSRFDTVVIDAPPILGLPDTTTLVDLSDAVLLVISAGEASHHDVESALERIDTGKIVGVVFNRSREAVKSYKSGYGTGKA